MFNKSSNIKVRFFVAWIVQLLLVWRKYINNTDHQQDIRSCSWYGWSTSDHIGACADSQPLITTDHYPILKVKYKNLNSFSQLLLILSDDVLLNPSTVHENTLYSLNEWNVLKNTRLDFICIYINTIFINNWGTFYRYSVFKSKLDASVSGINFDSYKILSCGRNGWSVGCYVTTELSYNVLSFDPVKLKIFSLKLY